MTIGLRSAGPRDVAGMFDVRTSVAENHLSLDALAEFGVTPDSVKRMLSTTAHAWVAEQDDEIVAFVIAEATEAMVFALFVLPALEGQGLGRALLGRAERWLFAHECEEIWLITDGDRRIRASGFYEHLGWTRHPVRPDGQVRYTKRRTKRRRVTRVVPRA